MKIMEYVTQASDDPNYDLYQHDSDDHDTIILLSHKNKKAYILSGIQDICLSEVTKGNVYVECMLNREKLGLMIPLHDILENKLLPVKEYITFY